MVSGGKCSSLPSNRSRPLTISIECSGGLVPGSHATYTTVCPATAKAAGLTQSTSGCGVPSPVSGITSSGESPNFGW